MKKIICTLAVAVIFLTGCGKSNGIISDEIGEVTNVNPATENINSTKPKTKTTTVSSETDTETTSSGNISSETTETKDTSSVQSETSSELSAESNVSVNPETSNTAPENTGINTAEASTVPTTSAEVYYLEGIVYEVHDKYIVINETDFKKMKVSVSDTSMIDGINIGDTVEITYDGLINEDSIRYTDDAYSIEVTKKADKKYNLQKYESNGVGFSMLVPEDWDNKVIAYPRDSDFTDWGIRFTPDGAVGSMDITWHSSITINGSFDKETVEINEISAKKYSRKGVWRFFVFENNYVATNNFFETSQHSDYADDMDLMLNSIEFL